MKLPRKYSRAFTIIELLVIIVVIGVLASVGIVSYSKVQATSRDARRSSSISAIAEALESYYQKNGEYPSCNMMSQSASSVSTTLLAGLSIDTLTAPTAASGTNSIQPACTDLSVGSGDLYSYIGDTSSNCTTGSACSNYTLKYREDSTNNIIAVKSRYGNETSFINTLSGTGSDSYDSAIQTLDGNYVAVGKTDSFGAGSWDAIISRYNSNGGLYWSKTLGSSGSDYASEVTQLADGGLVLVGFTSSADGGDSFITKFNLDGTIAWDRKWNNLGADIINNITRTNDNGFILSGQIINGANSADAFLAKFDSNGTLSWCSTWGGTDIDYANHAIQSSDGNYIIAGYTRSYGAGGVDSFIAKFNKDGTLIWDKTWGGSNWDQINSLAETSNKSIVIVGQTTSFGSGNTDGFVSKFKASGEHEWSRSWGKAYDDYFYDVKLALDENIYIAGAVVDTSFRGSAIIKYTQGGVFVSAFRIGGSSGSNNSESKSLSITSDAGYLITGILSGYGAGGNEALLAKTKSSLKVTNCTPLLCSDQAAGSLTVTPTILDPTATSTLKSPSITSGSLSISNTTSTLTFAAIP